jgi:hypothetical protein
VESAEHAASTSAAAAAERRTLNLMWECLRESVLGERGAADRPEMFPVKLDKVNLTHAEKDRPERDRYPE